MNDVHVKRSITNEATLKISTGHNIPALHGVINEYNS